MTYQRAPRRLNNLSVVRSLATAIDNETTNLPCFTSTEAMVRSLHPAAPVHAMHFDRLSQAAKCFVEHFPGQSYYAVKSNPSPLVLRQLYASGIRHFDVASLGEVRLLRSLFPKAHLAFMNPVKARESIRSAYFQFGVRDFVLDTADELQKILKETDRATDLCLIVRISMPKGSAACTLTDKFGCQPEDAIILLRAAEKVAAKVGLSFHVGSQTLDPDSYSKAIVKAGEIVSQAGVKLSVFDVGGGFPAEGMGMNIPELTTYFDVIRKEITKIRLPKTCKVWCEPGRALSACATTLVVRVELRKGQVLYINDGSYGNMFEMASMSWKNATHLIRSNKDVKSNGKALKPFRFYGPTCDSIDHMAGPFMLPEDVAEGDWIAIESMGAYMAASRSHFNGFSEEIYVEIDRRSHLGRRREKSGPSHLKLIKSSSVSKRGSV